jgi:hypothetical protein
MDTVLNLPAVLSDVHAEISEVDIFFMLGGGGAAIDGTEIYPDGDEI